MAHLGTILLTILFIGTLARDHYKLQQVQVEILVYLSSYFAMVSEHRILTAGTLEIPISIIHGTQMDMVH